MAQFCLEVWLIKRPTLDRKVSFSHRLSTLYLETSGAVFCAWRSSQLGSLQVTRKESERPRETAALRYRFPPQPLSRSRDSQPHSSQPPKPGQKPLRCCVPGAQVSREARFSLPAWLSFLTRSCWCPSPSAPLSLSLTQTHPPTHTPSLSLSL